MRQPWDSALRKRRRAGTPPSPPGITPNSTVAWPCGRPFMPPGMSMPRWVLRWPSTSALCVSFRWLELRWYFSGQRLRNAARRPSASSMLNAPSANPLPEACARASRNSMISATSCASGAGNSPPPCTASSRERPCSRRASRVAARFSRAAARSRRGKDLIMPARLLPENATAPPPGMLTLTVSGSPARGPMKPSRNQRPTLLRKPSPPGSAAPAR